MQGKKTTPKLPQKTFLVKKYIYIIPDVFVHFWGPGFIHFWGPGGHLIAVRNNRSVKFNLPCTVAHHVTHYVIGKTKENLLYQRFLLVSCPSSGHDYTCTYSIN